MSQALKGGWMKHVLMGLVACLTILLGCAPAAPPAPAPATGASTTVQPAAGAPNGAGATSADGRQQVIDGARAEGVVNAVIQSTWTPDGLRQLEDAVQREYGVAIKINFTPVGNYPQRLGELASELGAGATPSFDLYQSADATSLVMLQQDLLEAVDWTPLLPQGTPPAIVQGDNRLLVVYTDHTGLMYDPTVIPESEVPRSLKDLSNPRWRGRVMMYQYTSSYLPYVVRLGKEPTFTALRGAVQNGAVPDIFANEFTRFVAKEYPLVTVAGSFYHAARLRGVPAAFTSLDFSYNTDHHLMVAKKVAHPNAAKLLAAVLVGPEGQRIAEAQIGIGNQNYEGSLDHQLEAAALAAGFPTFHWWDNQEVRDLSLSPEGMDLQREMEQIFKGG
jgi:ABC-type Fe3+ transport system substrate-binding protein